MSDNEIQEHFVETVSNVSHANGVFRITFAQNEDENSIRPVTRLLIPANQLARILQGLNNAVKTIGEKVRESSKDLIAGSDKSPDTGKKKSSRK